MKGRRSRACRNDHRGGDCQFGGIAAGQLCRHIGVHGLRDAHGSGVDKHPGVLGDADRQFQRQGRRFVVVKLKGTHQRRVVGNIRAKNRPATGAVQQGIVANGQIQRDRIRACGNSHLCGNRNEGIGRDKAEQHVG